MHGGMQALQLQAIRRFWSTRGWEVATPATIAAAAREHEGLHFRCHLMEGICSHLPSHRLPTELQKELHMATLMPAADAKPQNGDDRLIDIHMSSSAKHSVPRCSSNIGVNSRLLAKAPTCLDKETECRAGHTLNCAVTGTPTVSYSCALMNPIHEALAYHALIDNTFVTIPSQSLHCFFDLLAIDERRISPRALLRIQLISSEGRARASFDLGKPNSWPSYCAAYHNGPSNCLCILGAQHFDKWHVALFQHKEHCDGWF